MSSRSSKLWPCHSGAPRARKKASYTLSLVCHPVPISNTQMLVQWFCYFSQPSAAPLGDGFLRRTDETSRKEPERLSAADSRARFSRNLWYSRPEAVTTNNIVGKAFQTPFLGTYPSKNYPHNFLRPVINDYVETRLGEGLVSLLSGWNCLPFVDCFSSCSRWGQAADVMFNPAKGVKVRKPRRSISKPGQQSSPPLPL